MQTQSYDDPVMHWLTLAVPVMFLIGGIVCLIAAISGKTGKKENPAAANMTAAQRKRFRRNEILLGCIVSIGMIGFGVWLLYCWLFGPIQL